MARSFSASARTSGAGRRLILTGARVTLRSTVMFWNRLYCWNTIAIWSRAARIEAALR
jgi:hypothetical protein